MPIENSAGDYGYGPSDSFISEQVAQGQKTYDKQRYGKPQFGFPDVSNEQVSRDRLLSVLLGASAGANAAGNAQHPLAAIAMGLGGGIGSQNQLADLQAHRQAQEMQLRNQQLDLTPLGEISPGLSEKLRMDYGMDVSNMPLGHFKQISPLLQGQVKAQEATKMFLASTEAKKLFATASPEAQLVLEKLVDPEGKLPVGWSKNFKTSELSPMISAVNAKGQRQMPAAVIELQANTKEGIKSIDRAMELFKTATPQERLAAMSGDGRIANAARTLSPVSQELNNNLKAATDVITRIRTGAALNKEEQVFYDNLVASFWRSGAQNEASMQKLKSFFQDVQNNINSGGNVKVFSLLGADPQRANAMIKKLGLDPKNIDLNKTINTREIMSAPNPGATSPGMVTLVAPNGEPFQVPQANVGAAIARGARTQ